MDNRSLGAPGVRIDVDTRLQIGALRYCDPAAVRTALQRVGGDGVPPVRRAVVISSAADPQGILLLWRSPTETLVVSDSSTPLRTLAAELATASEACLVDQSGGCWALRMRGPRSVDLLVRLGATSSIPRLGESLQGRLADLSVHSVRVRDDEVLLFVDRLYADHLLGWIGETIADFHD